MFAKSDSSQEFDMIDLLELCGKDAVLEVYDAGDRMWQVTVPESAVSLVAEDGRQCISAALVNVWFGLFAPEYLHKRVSRYVKVGEFWQYGDDFMSNRILSIKLEPVTTVVMSGSSDDLPTFS